jgi:protein required for attachment to host cells
MKTKLTWILVADGTRGRILLHAGPGSGLVPATGRGEYAGDNRPTRKIGSDRPGRTIESADGSRHAYAPRVDWHEFAKHEFAAKMASILNRRHARKEFDELILVAPAKTLGDLRAALDKPTLASVRHELVKDLVNVRNHDLAKYLDAVLVS